MNKKAKKISALQKLVSSNPNFQFIQNGKIKCKITNHQFLPSIQNYQQHLQSKSYKKAIQAEFDISQFEDFLQTHRQNKNFLFCKLTGAKVPKKKTAIQKHVNGKKFLKRLQQYKAMIEQQKSQQEDQNEQNQDLQQDQDQSKEQKAKVQVKNKKGGKNKKTK